MPRGRQEIGDGSDLAMSWFRRNEQRPDRSDSSDDQPLDPATVERRRSRLTRRISNLEHDIRQARSANQRGNQWQRRIEEIDAAIAQASADADAIQHQAERHRPVALSATPVRNVNVSTEIPATVRFEIGNESFRYAEEIDWTERGEQRSQPGLRRFDGDPDALVPADLPEHRAEALREHLRHAIGAYAIALRDGQVSIESSPSLSALATPCSECGNWRDLRDRCITCQRVAWRASEVQAEVRRMLDERNRLMDEISRQREALPILERQLRDAKTELQRYESA